MARELTQYQLARAVAEQRRNTIAGLVPKAPDPHDIEASVRIARDLRLSSIRGVSTVELRLYGVRSVSHSVM